MQFFRRVLLIFFSFFLFSYTLFNNNCLALNVDDDDDEIYQKTIEQIYSHRNKAFLTGDTENLENYYYTEQNVGLWSYEHEIRRIKYLRNWAEEKGIKFVDINSDVNIKKISSKKDKKNIFLEESYKFDYIYPDEPDIINSFGVGMRHTVNLIEKDNSWIIYNDWYTDCFEDALTASNIYDEPNIIFTSNTSNLETSNSTLGKQSYNRAKAIEYANKYCGLAWGNSNNFKYNKKYTNYEGAGGDCTNFTSQVLGDKEEGGSLPFDSAWYCKYKKNSRAIGSTAWVNASSFKNYILYSGKGALIKKGNYKEVTSPTENNPEGAINKIMPGDLIAYEKKGKIEHFSIVTDTDSKGYPLVNSHTTDRYHVPWDLGWNTKNIKFNLIHIRD